MKRVLASSVIGLALRVVGVSAALDLTDQTTNGNNLINHGAVENTSSLPFAADNIRTADLERDSSQYLYAVDSASLSLTGDFTVEFWLKGESDPHPAGAQDGYLFSKFGASGNYSFRFMFYGDGAGHYNIWGNISDDGTSDSGHWISMKSPDLTGTWTNWNHIALVWDASIHTMEYYINGSSQGTTQSAANVTSIYDGTGKYAIGVSNLDTTPSGTFDGMFDDFRVWNDSRTSAEIADNYAQELTGIEAGLVAYWPFETVNLPPTAFSLLAPSNNTSTNDNTPTFSWGASTDPESQPVTYTLKLSTTAGFTEPVYRTVSSLSSPSYPAVTVIADGSYYWKVIASDGVLQTESTQTWQLTVDTQKPVTPVINSMYPDFATGKITKIYGTGETGTTLILYDKNGGTVSGTTEWYGGNFTFAPTTPLDPGSSVYAKSQDGALNISQSRISSMYFEEVKDVSKDIAVYHGSVPETSMRLEKDTSCKFDIAVNAGAAVTARAWLMYNADYDGSGADAPLITLSGLGITTGNTAAMTAPASYTPDTWEQLTVSGTPNAKGVVTLKVETFSTADGAKTWVDDISVSQ